MGDNLFNNQDKKNGISVSTECIDRRICNFSVTNPKISQTIPLIWEKEQKRTHVECRKKARNQLSSASKRGFQGTTSTDFQPRAARCPPRRSHLRSENKPVKDASFPKAIKKLSAAQCKWQRLTSRRRIGVESAHAIIWGEGSTHPERRRKRGNRPWRRRGSGAGTQVGGGDIENERASELCGGLDFVAKVHLMSCHEPKLPRLRYWYTLVLAPLISAYLLPRR